MSHLTSGDREPGVIFKKLPTPKQLILPAGAAEVAFVGKSKLTSTVTEEEVTRQDNGTAGDSVSDSTPATSTSGGETLDINVHGDGVQTITLAASGSGADVATDIEAKVRALSANNPSFQSAYDAFTAAFTTVYTLTAGLTGGNSSVVISGGTGAAALKLGTANGGTETQGVGGTDTLANTATSVGSIFDENGVTYFLTTDFTQTGATIDWTPTGNEPIPGVDYFVTYEVAKTGSDFDVKIFFSFDDFKLEYGNPSTTNELSLAAQFYFNNGGVKLRAVQVDTNSGDNLTNFLVAFDKMAGEPIDVIIALQANTLGFESIFSQIKGRIFQLAQPTEGAERIAFVAPTIGTTITQYQTLATSLNFERMVVTAPESVLATVNGTQVTLPAYFLNAAMAGFLGDPDNSVAEPLTRKEIFGFDSLGTSFTRTQVRSLLGSGVLVIEQIDILIRVVQGMTTDRSSVENNEISLVRVGDFFGKTLRRVLDQIYIGTRLDATAIASIRTTITTIIDNFVSKGVLTTFADLSVTQNENNPTAVDIFLRVQPIFPLNFIDVEFTLELL